MDKEKDAYVGLTTIGEPRVRILVGYSHPGESAEEFKQRLFTEGFMPIHVVPREELLIQSVQMAAQILDANGYCDLAADALTLLPSASHADAKRQLRIARLERGWLLESFSAREDGREDGI